jgi:hypothetical protein
LEDVLKLHRETCLVAVAALALGLTLLPAAHAQNIISTVVGGGPTPTAPLSADIPGPASAVRDAAGNTYIAAPYSAYIFELNAAGTTLTDYAGQGYGGFNGDGGLAGASVLGNPDAIAIDSHGNIFIADYGSSRVREVAAGTGIITTIAGSGVKCDLSTNACGDGGPATSAQLNLPEAVAVDGAGNVYIADAVDNKIRVVNMQTSSITIAGVAIPAGDIATVAGSGATCANPSSPCGDGAAATSAQLNFPEGVAVDGSGNIYIGDTADQRVRIVSSAGIISPFAGNGGFCQNPIPLGACGDGHAATSALLHRPQQVAWDSLNGALYIADTMDQKIRMVDNTGTINLVAGNGHQAFAGDGAVATAAELDLPVGVSVDSSGNILVSDSGNQRVRLVTAATGLISTIAGGGMGGDGGAATSATLAFPYNITEDSHGNLFFADTGNNRIRVVNMQTSPIVIAGVSIPAGAIATVAGTGAQGWTGDGAAATSATLNGPTSVSVDPSGNFFIADYGNLVIREVTAAGVINTVAGNGNPCSPTTAVCGDGGAATSGNLTAPLTVITDANDNLYIADYYSHRIRKVTASTQFISTYAGTGAVGYFGNGGAATAARLSHPSSVTLDSLGNLYIADQWNFRIREVNASTGKIGLYALDGKTCLCGDGGPALNGSYWDPLEVSMDPSNNLFIGGGNANVVQRVDSITATWGTVAGNAADALIGGFNGDGGLAVNATLANYGLVVDAGSNLYIADGGNNRIRTVHLTPAAKVPTQPLNFGNVPLNTASPAKSTTLTSVGGVDLSVTSIAVTGANSSNFTQTNTCGTIPGSRGVDEACKIGVVFTPTNYGQTTATLTITDNDPSGTQNVSLSGSGPDFGIMVTPTKVTVARGANGTATLKLVPEADFNQLVSLTCSGAPAGTTCTVPPSEQMNGTTDVTATVSIAVGSTTTTGVYPLTLRGTFFPLSHPTTLTLTVK